MEIRERKNLILFIMSYVVNNIASGVMYDTYVNYMQEVARPIATSFWSFYGYASFLSAALLLLIPKIGYKKLLALCSLSNGFAFLIAVYGRSTSLLQLATLMALIGVQLHFIILAPYVSAYTETMEDHGIAWYTRTYYLGYIGYFLSTYLGGVLVVRNFSKNAKIAYSVAKEATCYIGDMSTDFYSSYLEANKEVLIFVAIISFLALVPVLFIKEYKEDYAKVEDSSKKLSLSEKTSSALKILLNRDARIYITFWILISFAMGLFTSYYTVFLNRNLHIDKATSSLMVSISYIAIVLFLFFTPYVVKKIGRVGTIAFAVLLSVPFMIVIGAGKHFGAMTIPVVGTALFIRAGLANLSSPVESSLAMSIVPKNLRPAYTALINFLAGIISVLSGIFTGKILFVNQSGYEYAYYIAAVLYGLAGFLILLILKKYNQEEEEEKEN